MCGLTPSQIHRDLGVTAPAKTFGINEAQAFGIEFILTFMLVFTIFATTDPGKEHRGYEIPLSIGLCVFICHVVGVGCLALSILLCFKPESLYYSVEFERAQEACKIQLITISSS